MSTTLFTLWSCDEKVVIRGGYMPIGEEGDYGMGHRWRR
jgi:hypothetical protein